MGQWYPVASIDWHGNGMTSMMILRQRYTLVFAPSNARKPCQGMDCLRDCVAEKGILGNFEGE